MKLNVLLTDLNLPELIAVLLERSDGVQEQLKEIDGIIDSLYELKEDSTIEDFEEFFVNDRVDVNFIIDDTTIYDLLLELNERAEQLHNRTWRLKDVANEIKAKLDKAGENVS